jgi:hypothetical protein
MVKLKKKLIWNGQVKKNQKNKDQIKKYDMLQTGMKD